MRDEGSAVVVCPVVREHRAQESFFFSDAKKKKKKKHTTLLLSENSSSGAACCRCDEEEEGTLCEVPLPCTANQLVSIRFEPNRETTFTHKVCKLNTQKNHDATGNGTETVAYNFVRERFRGWTVFWAGVIQKHAIRTDRHRPSNTDPEPAEETVKKRLRNG